MVENLAIDYARLGTLVGIYMLPGLVLSLPGGLLGQRFGDKQVAVVGLALMVLGGLWIALSPSYGLMTTGRLVSGVGAVLLNILLAKMVTDWFSGGEIALAMGLFVSSWPVGIGLGLVLLPAFATASSTSSALLATGAVSAAALVLTLALYRSPPGLASGKASLRIELSRREWGLSFLSGMVWTLYNVGFVLVLSFGPSFLTENGLSVASAGATISLATWTILLLLPFGGYFAQRLNWPNGVMIGCFLAIAVFICGLALRVSPVLACIAIGLFAGPPAGLIMALPGSVLRPESRSAGMGVYYTCYYAGMTGLVALAGLLGEAFQNPSAPLFFAATLMVGAVASLAGFRALSGAIHSQTRAQGL